MWSRAVATFNRPSTGGYQTMSMVQGLYIRQTAVKGSSATAGDTC